MQTNTKVYKLCFLVRINVNILLWNVFIARTVRPTSLSFISNILSNTVNVTYEKKTRNNVVLKQIKFTPRKMCLYINHKRTSTLNFQQTRSSPQPEQQPTFAVAVARCCLTGNQLRSPVERRHRRLSPLPYGIRSRAVATLTHIFAAIEGGDVLRCHFVVRQKTGIRTWRRGPLMAHNYPGIVSINMSIFMSYVTLTCDAGQLRIGTVLAGA